MTLLGRFGFGIDADSFCFGFNAVALCFNLVFSSSSCPFSIPSRVSTNLQSISCGIQYRYGLSHYRAENGSILEMHC